MITIHAWDRTTRTPRTLDRAVLEDESLRKDPNQVIWVDLSEPTKEEEDCVFQRFLPIHPLSVEDIIRLRREPDAPPHLPKVEEFADYLFVIVNPLRPDFLKTLDHVHAGVGELERHFTQLSAILTHSVLITHHYEPLSCVEQVQRFLERHQGQADRGPDYLFHLVLDGTVDQFAPVLDHIDDSLDAVEVRILKEHSHRLFQSILRMKRTIIVLRKILIYEREVLVRLARGEFDLVDERETIYYRNVYDHLVRFTELIESSREMATDLLQSYLASTSNRLNQIMKTLTMISTIVLPMSLIAGIYGMNFKFMPELEAWWGYPLALGLMLIVGIVSFAFFHWKKWL